MLNIIKANKMPAGHGYQIRSKHIKKSKPLNSTLDFKNIANESS
jgi:hypothetical protein